MNQFLRVKTKKKGGCCGFTLIELLVVIVIIGLLASVLLITVRQAINKARDTRIISAIGQIRTQAEIFYDNQLPPTYAGLNNDSTVQVAVTDAQNNGGAITWGVLNITDYAVWSRLVSDKTLAYCVDATGRAGKKALIGLQAGVSVDCGL